MRVIGGNRGRATALPSLRLRSMARISISIESVMIARIHMYGAGPAALAIVEIPEESIPMPLDK